MATITLKLQVSEVSAAAVRNAVRRSLTNTEFTEDSGEVKGLSYKIKRPTSKPLTDAGVIRAWARENGHEVGQRGRLKPEVVEAYAAAHA